MNHFWKESRSVMMCWSQAELTCKNMRFKAAQFFTVGISPLAEKRLTNSNIEQQLNEIFFTAISRKEKKCKRVHDPKGIVGSLQATIPWSRISGRSEKTSLLGRGIAGLINYSFDLSKFDDYWIPRLPFEIVACTYVLFSDKLSRKSCTMKRYL